MGYELGECISVPHDKMVDCWEEVLAWEVFLAQEVLEAVSFPTSCLIPVAGAADHVPSPQLVYRKHLNNLQEDMVEGSTNVSVGVSPKLLPT